MRQKRVRLHLPFKVILVCVALGCHEEALIDEHLQALALPHLGQQSAGLAAGK